MTSCKEKLRKSVAENMKWQTNFSGVENMKFKKSMK
jgi:hypothetical protein